MWSKLRPRRASKRMALPMNRSKHLEGARGHYDGKPTKTKFLYLPEIREEQREADK